MSKPPAHRSARFVVAAILLTCGPAHAAADLYEEALSQFRNGEFKSAIVNLKNVLQAQPRNLPGLVLMGKALLEVGNGAGAEAALRRAREGGADRAIIIVPLGRALLAQRKYEAVLSELSGSGHNESLQAAILVLKGEALVGLERKEEARKTLKEASALAPLEAGPRVGLARLALADGHPGIATAHTAKALLLDPERSRMVLATLPEEMAVREALELESFCRERRMRTLTVIVGRRQTCW